MGGARLGDQEEGQNVEHGGAEEHAHVVPAPAAVMSDEVDGSLVEKIMLLLHD